MPCLTAGPYGLLAESPSRIARSSVYEAGSAVFYLLKNVLQQVRNSRGHRWISQFD